MSLLNQKTINKKITISGIGLHSGKNVNLKILPSKENTGIVFLRSDLGKDNVVIPHFNNVSDTTLCTTIQNSSGVKVSTIEHLMAAFYGLGIDNALVELDAQEVPILDGSAKEWIEILMQSGISTSNAPIKIIKINKNIKVDLEDKFIEINKSKVSLDIDFEIKYPGCIIGTQRNKLNILNDDLSKIYESRTFCKYEDIDNLKKSGFAKGGSLDNAIVVDKNKVLNKSGLRNSKEFVNHKILDLAGDFFLTGFRMIGNISCVQGGHQLSINFLQKLLKDESNFLIFDSVETKDNKDKIQYSVQKFAVNA